MGKKQIFVGIDQDVSSIRGVRLIMEAPPTKKDASAVWKLASYDELGADLSDNDKVSAAVKKIKDKVGIQAGDIVSICLAGKQTYVVQMDVKRLPEEEMPSMLRLEMRKSMPFEASVSTFDYQYLPTPEDHDKSVGVPVIVSAVSNSFMAKRLHAYENAGVRPLQVSVLPVTVANAFWATKTGKVDDAETHVILHVGAETCTLVIDGGKSPFFNRSFSFNANELIATKDGETEATSQAMLQLNILASEINKSVSYYRNTYGSGNISTLTVMGSYANDPAFDVLGRKTGYTVQTIQTAQMVQSIKPPPAGRYDLAIALAMQAAGA